jgi:threonine dehydrogenase-like Zn-dependent dehydrogenase
MKAAVFKGVGRPLVIEDRADPAPQEGEVIIKVGRCGLCSSDLHMTSGHGITYPPDSILGHEYAGEVVEVGRGVDSLKVGDRITAMPMKGCGACAECLAGFPLGCPSMQSMMSGYGEYARVATRSAVKLPQSLSLADGALIEPLASSLRGVAMAGIRPGSHVAVLGAGTIGLGAIFWAHRQGAGRIAAVARTERQKDLALQMGATHFLTQGEDLGQRLGAVFGGLPEVVFECVGAPGSLSAAVDMVAPRGTVVALGMCMVADSVTPFLAGLKSTVIRFSAAYELRDFETAADTMDRGAVAPRAMVKHTISLSELPDTFERLRHAPRGSKTLVSPFLES